ncbi:MAG: response regulator [Elusimicrobiota bacterium]
MKNTEKTTVMVVDDDVDFLDEIAIALYAREYDVISVTNGKDAISNAREKDIDIILLDIRLKDISGFQVGNKLTTSEVTKNIPILAITGIFLREEDKKVMEACGIQKLLEKPVDPEELIREMDDVLKKENRLV